MVGLSWSNHLVTSIFHLLTSFFIPFPRQPLELLDSTRFDQSLPSGKTSRTHRIHQGLALTEDGP